jgi:ssDNA-binding Zn-finger/Zn-ribbon topoisomerase 1
MVDFAKKRFKPSGFSPLEEKTCPICGDKLVIRKRRKDDIEFWGCSNFFSGSCTFAMDKDSTIEDGKQKFLKRMGTEFLKNKGFPEDGRKNLSPEEFKREYNNSYDH